MESTATHVVTVSGMTSLGTTWGDGETEAGRGNKTQIDLKACFKEA